MRGTTLASLALATLAVFACSGDGTSPTPSPLASFSHVDANDTGSTTPPGTIEPGSFHGNVLGLPVTSGGDTTSNSTRLAGLKVTAYPYLGELNADGTPKIGAQAASVTTDANGQFQLPTLAGGTYVVAFAPQPPSDASWRGGWTLGTTSAQSNQYPWWIYLQHK